MNTFKKYCDYIKWGFESRLKPMNLKVEIIKDYIKWGFERLNNF